MHKDGDALITDECLSDKNAGERCFSVSKLTGVWSGIVLVLIISADLWSAAGVQPKCLHFGQTEILHTYLLLGTLSRMDSASLQRRGSVADFGPLGW